MSNNTKISVEIRSDGEDTINSYSNAFNDLRVSVEKLSQPFNSLSRNLNALDNNMAKYNDGLTKLNDQSKTFVSTGEKVTEKVSQVSNSFVSWFVVLKEMSGGIKKFAGAISGGIGLLIAFLPEIINFATSLFKGKDAVSAMTLNLKNLNEVMKAANQDATTEISRLKLLAAAAADVNNSMNQD